jgi:hypothetical protein
MDMATTTHKEPAMTTTTPVAKSSACWIPLNDPQGMHHFQCLGDYVITRMRWTQRPTTFTVSHIVDDTHVLVLQTDDYAEVLDLILGGK